MKGYYHDLVAGRTAQRRWKERNPERALFLRKRCGWRRQGIINPDGSEFLPINYDRIFQIQQGRCGICKRHQSDMPRTFHVDHDHKTGFVRGLLCDICNGKLGILEDLAFIEKAKVYLSEVR